ncbi:MAG: 50S ribosomal protein L18 [Dehalococcoidia bacterium]|nr:MAG: 50S ribosomal protein L18 [Dehalococcoidia bacterium]
MVERNYKRVARYGRHARVREKVKGTELKPRMCVFRSLQHIYAQVIDDSKGHTIISASSTDPEIKSEMNGKKKVAQAEIVGKLLAKRVSGMGIKQVVFDRGGYKYHGRVRMLAEAARKSGLKF